jgi:hypothetical protein
MGTYKPQAESPSIRDLLRKISNLNREIRQLMPGSDAFIKKSNQLTATRAMFTDVINEIKV